jgi:hypothetical protein
VAALAAAGSTAGALAQPAARTSASVGTVSFSTTPGLFPSFSPDDSDYVVRCTPESSVQVSVSNSDATDTTTTVSVDRRPPQTGSFIDGVPLDAGQEFSVEVTQGATTKDYFVRCLPPDFPTWTVDRPGTPQAEYYVVAPSLAGGSQTRYLTIYDTNGVPIWWISTASGDKALDAKLAANGDILWTDERNGVPVDAEDVRLNGSVVNGMLVPDGYAMNEHEIQLLPHGDYLLIGNHERCCYELSSYGGSASASLFDNVIQEVTPGGTAVWTWDAADHIGLDEVVPQWWPTAIAAANDVFHLNSVEMDADGNLLVSARYEGVYKVTSPTSATNPGKIIWKLGGSAPTLEPAEHLTVIGDPVFDAGGGFGGQHYARYYDAGDGNLYVTLHDNGTNDDRPPRGVRYRIDETAGTATMVEDVRDNAAPDFRSICCGSAARLPQGNWVMSWGYSTSMTELTPAGDRVFVLTFDEPSYRADAVLPGVLSRTTLRAGMDVQHPRSNPDTDGDGCPDANELFLVPPTDSNNQWDFYSVPVPALIAAPNPLTVTRDRAVTAGDAEAVFAYFKAGAKSGTTAYDQDLNNNGIADGIEYDRTVLGSGMSGAPDGVIGSAEAQVAFTEFKNGYHC